MGEEDGLEEKFLDVEILAFEDKPEAGLELDFLCLSFPLLIDED